MKDAILILCLWLSWSSAAAQFRMIGTATWTTLTDSTYAATINFQPDLTNNGYLATQVVDGFRMFTGTEQVYTVNVNEMLSTFSSIVAVVTEYNGDHGVPTGQVMVYDPAGRATIPQAPYGNTGSTSQMQAAVDTYNARLVGTAGVDLSPYPKRTELADSAAAIRSDFPVGGAVIDSTRLTQDSILVYYQDGAEVGRDTIAGVGGGGADNLGNHIMTQNLITDGNWISGDGGNEGISVDASGNVGIGTLTPSYILDINSTDAVRLPVGTTAQNPTGATGLLRYNSDSTAFTGYYNAQWNRLVDANFDLTDFTSSLTENYVPIANASGNLVNSNLRQYNNTNLVFSTKSITYSSGLSNIFIGNNAGPSTIQGSRNTGIGEGAGGDLTTGGSNVLIGRAAGTKITTGSSNLFVGDRAGFGASGAITGGSNLAFGTQSGYNIADGNRNITIGQYAGFGVTSASDNTYVGYGTGWSNDGTRNTALGSTAGRYIADGATNVTSSTHGLFLGVNTKAAGHGNTNETVIGYNAIGNGSNTVTIGNSSVTGTYLRNVRLSAGTATANTSPLKFTSGTNLTTPEAGAVEWDGTNLFITQSSGPTRKTIAYVDTDDGSASDTTDGSGDITVSHTLGSASITVTATTTGTTFYHVQVHTKTSTTFKIRFFDATGAAVTATAVTADWIAKLQ